MDLTAGLVLVAITIVMLVVGRPSDGVAAPYLKNWVAGQAYTLTALASAVLGVTVIVANWPF